MSNIRVFVQKLYLCIFVISSSCYIQSNALDRFFGTPPANLMLSNDFFAIFNKSNENVFCTVSFPISGNENGKKIICKWS